MKSDTRSLPAASAVEQVEVKSGVALKCVRQQVGENGNPKHRTTNDWGIGKKSIDDAAALK